MSYKRMLLRPAVQNLFIECNLACLHEILLETVSYHFSSLASHRQDNDGVHRTVT